MGGKVLYSTGVAPAQKKQISGGLARDIALAAAAALAVRILFILFVSGESISQDGLHAAAVAGVLRRGGNPYVETAWLNWPPFWMQILFALDRTALWSGLPFIALLQGFLLASETLLIAALGFFLRDALGVERPLPLLLAGISLNPAAIISITLAGHFDVLVGLAALLTLIGVCRFSRSGEVLDWLLASAALGAGILAKTVPFVLSPLLLFGVRRIDWRGRLLGLLLVLGPAALGLSVIYVLSPEDVGSKVIGYLSVAGWFGVTGIMHLLGWDWFSRRIYPGMFFLALLALMMAGARSLQQRREIRPRELTLWAAAPLLLSISLGPGYGAQYHYWVLPLAAAMFASAERPFLRGCIAAYWAVAALTLFFQYGADTALGGFFRSFPALEWMAQWYMSLPSKAAGTISNLPLFAVLAALLAAVLSELGRERSGRSEDGEASVEG